MVDLDNNNEPDVVKASIHVMIHLSAIHVCSGIFSQQGKHIAFIRYIIYHCEGDLNKKINHDLLWIEFCKNWDE